GYYTGPVTANITAPAGSTYVLDGSPSTAQPTSGAVVVSTAGEHTLTVTDPNGDTATQAFAISTYQTTTSLSSNPTSSVVGQQVSFTAAVAAASSGVGSPGGNVEFFDGTTPIAGCGGASGTALSGGDALCLATYTSPGAHEITASYLGGGGFSASTSGSLGLTVSPRSATVSAVSVTGSPATYGGETSLQFSATVTAGDSGSFPSGDTVSVTHGATPICTINLSTLSGNSGSGSCSPSSGTVLPAGTYTNGITATFNSTGADPNFLAAAPVTASVTITQATPTITWATPAAITYGTPLSTTQLDAKASVPGTFTYSPAAGTVLQPGTQTLSVTFTPTDTTDYTSATGSTTLSVGFTQACITTTDSGSLTVAKGQVICISTGGKVTGSVSVAAGGALWVSGGTIGGSLSSSGALGITLCGAKVTGSVSVTGTSGPVVMGGSGCASDTVGGSLSVTGNTDGVVFDSNSVTGSLTISSNAGGVTISGNTVTGSAAVSSNTGGVTFTSNKVTGSLAITNNSGPFTYSGNTVSGSVTNSGNT
ncbi:MAG TPA: Ig-like domain repeat protein, partial [Acidimicrobiales bacterium]|nr:Ig-like domain repeat protein [Acidimicrobiales bacterium]